MTARTPEIVRTGGISVRIDLRCEKDGLQFGRLRATVIMPAYAAHGFSALMGLINSGIRQHI